MDSSTLFGVVVVPAVIGLVHVARIGGLPKRYAPIAAVLLGIVASLAQYFAVREPWIPPIVTGIGMGLSACGLYAGAQSLLAGDSTDLEYSNSVPVPGTPTAAKGIVLAGGATPDRAPTTTD